MGRRSILKKWYFWGARPKDGILPIERAGNQARPFVRSPEEPRIIEPAGSAG
jgi:hypothetical protein